MNFITRTHLFILAAALVVALACNAPVGQPGGSAASSPDSKAAGAATSGGSAPGTALPVGREQIVYTCFVDGSDEICLMNPDGTDQRQLTNDKATDFYGALSPDGATIAFSTRRDGPFEIYTMDTQGHNLKRLTQNQGDNYAPSYSPDGSRIVFISTASGNQDVWVMNADGSKPTQITNRKSEEYDPTWSPDGSQIAFASSYTGTNELYVINADGTNLRQVTAGSGMREGGRSDWSPDGKTLAIYTGRLADKNILLVPASCADGPKPCGPSEFTQVTNGGNAKGPSFSPDGQWIVFAGGPTKNNDVFIIKIDGSGLKQLTSGPLSEWQPRWGK